MAKWLKARLESLLDNLIFAGIVAGGVAVWTVVKALPVLVIVGIAAGVFVVILASIKLILKFLIKPQAKETSEDEYIPKLIVEPSSGRRESDWERTEHLMWAELQVTNMSNQPLEGVGVNIVTCLTVQKKQNSLNGNDYLVWDFLKWHQTSVYWSERNAQPKQLELTIPAGATRVSLVAFQDNSNGGNFVFNSPHHEWSIDGFKIDVEISSSTAVVWKSSYYIRCHPNYLGGDRAKFEFTEWDKWAINYNIIPLGVDKADSQTE